MKMLICATMALYGVPGLGMPRVCYDARDPNGGAADVKALETSIKEVGASLKKVSDELKQSGESLKTEMKNLGDATKETKEKVDAAMVANGTMSGRLQEMEQALARISQGNGGARSKTIGQTVVESEQFKSFDGLMAKNSVRIPVKQTITSLTTDADGSAGDLVRPDRVAGVIVPAQRRMTIRQLLMPGRTSSNLIEFVKETGFTNNAGPQAAGAEGGAKGESTLKFDLKNSPVVTIAHFMRASKQILDDAAQLQTHIDTRLRYGLMLKEEDDLLNGAGSGGVLTGLLDSDNCTAFDPAFTPDDETMIDIIRLAFLQAALAEWPATGVVIHPTDWAKIELTKDSQGRYIFANPQSLAGPTLWGQPCIPTQAMDERSFLAGAFTPAAQIFDREDSNVQISTEDATNFTTNLVTIRAEQRLALVVYRPEALISGGFGQVS